MILQSWDDGVAVESRVGSISEIWLNRELLRRMQSASDVKQKVSEVFELLQDSVFRYLVRVLDDPSEAEDVMQETFIRLYRALHKGQVIEDVRPWIFRVAHNLVLYQFRRRVLSSCWILRVGIASRSNAILQPVPNRGYWKRNNRPGLRLPWLGSLRRRNTAWSFEPKD